MFQRIFVPLDESPRAEQALPVAARIARANAGSIILFEVISSPTNYADGLAPVSLLSDDLVEVELNRATTYLGKMARSEVVKGLHVETEAQFGIPMERILRGIGEHAADLVVLCSHGRTGLSRWMLGSVARHIIHHSNVPVLILREKGIEIARPQGNNVGPFSGVVSLDGSLLAETALLPAANLVAALAAPFHGCLHLVHVMRPLSAAATEAIAPELNSEAEETAKTYMHGVWEHLLEQVAGLNLSVTYSVLQNSDVAGAILEAAEHGTNLPQNGQCCSLIAMSTSGRGGFERWVLGSVTERVLDAAALPMLVVRPKEEDLHTLRDQNERVVRVAH